MAFVPSTSLPAPRVARSRSRHPRMIRAPPTRPRVASPAPAPSAAPARFPFAYKEDVQPDSSVPASSPTTAPPQPVHHKPKVRRRDVSPCAPGAATASSTAAVRELAPRRERQREFYYDDLSSVREVDVDMFTPPATQKKASRKTVASSEDSVRTYLREIGEVKLLDSDIEVNLAREIAKLLELERLSVAFKQNTGRDPSISEWASAAQMDIEFFRDTLRRGLRAKEHMVAANLRLVVSIAKKYLNRGLTFQDLIQEGSIGLIRGAEKFDADKGFKFSTYATWWIRQAITRAIADHSRPIRLPVHVNDTIAAIKKTTKLLHNELSRPPTEAEIADRMHISIEKLRFLASSSRSTISLETPIAKDGRDSSATLGSFIVWNGDTPEESTTKSLLREDLENVLNTLSPRERDVVRMRYGFDDGKMKTLEEIGSIFEVTRERIRQIEAKALRKLRHPNRNAVLREYVYEEQ